MKRIRQWSLLKNVLEAQKSNAEPHWDRIEARLRELGKLSESDKEPSFRFDLEDNALYLKSENDIQVVKDILSSLKEALSE